LVVTEDNALATWCYQGTGIAKTVAQIGQCGRVPTQGWTLEKWQQYLPCITALTDYIDRVAMQCAMNDGAASNSTVSMRVYGTPVIEKTMTIACGRNVQIYGGGSGTRISQVAASEGVFTICDGENNSGRVQFYTISMSCDTASNCGIPIKSYSVETNIDNVEITATVGRWQHGPQIIGGGGHIVRRLNVYMGPGTISGTCLFADTPPDLPQFSVILDVAFSHFYSCGIGAHIQNNGTTFGYEGVRFHTVDIDQVIEVFKVTNNQAAYQPPEYIFNDIQSSFFQRILVVDGSNPIIGSVWIKDGWYIQLAPTAASGTPSSEDLITLGGSDKVWFVNNSIVQAAGASFDWILNIPSGAEVYNITGNSTQVLLGTIVNGLINIQSGAEDILEKDNNWAYAGTRVSVGNTTDPRVVSYDWLAQASSNKCHFAGYSFKGTLTNSQIICTDLVTGTTTAGSALAITYPITFGVAPWPFSEAKVGSTCGTQSTYFTSATTTGVTYNYAACASQNVNMSYGVRGR
jgi:hypothetical protein